MSHRWKLALLLAMSPATLHAQSPEHRPGGILGVELGGARLDPAGDPLFSGAEGGPAEVVRWMEADNPVLLLGMGDSVTRGYGASEPSRSCFRIVERRLRESLETRAGTKVLAHNLAVDGSTSCDHVRDQIPRLSSLRASLLHASEVTGIAPREWMGRLKVVVLLTTGGNDIIHGVGDEEPTSCAMYGCTARQAAVWAPAFGIRLMRILDAIGATFSGTPRVYLGTIFDPTDGTGAIDEIGRIVPGARQLPPWSTGREEGLQVLSIWNMMISRLSSWRPGTRSFDMHRLLMGRGLTAAQEGRMDEYAYDPIIEDPNDLGHQLIGEHVAREILARDLDYLLQPRTPSFPAPPPGGGGTDSPERP